MPRLLRPFLFVFAALFGVGLLGTGPALAAAQAAKQETGVAATQAERAPGGPRGIAEFFDMLLCVN